MNMDQNQPNQPGDYEVKRQQKIKTAEITQRNKKINKIAKISIISVLIAAPVIGLGWYAATRPPIPETDIISKNGLHWHAELSIEINGQKQEIPANIGIGAAHNPIHTHDASGTVHLEIQGLVTKNMIKLARFFKVWDKQFNADCIFDSCNGEGVTVKMFINGKENAEFENYQMQDEDKIEIKYERNN